MKPPICRVCGIAHWGSDHVFPGHAAEKKMAKEREQKVEPPLKPAKPEAPKAKPAVQSPAKSKPAAQKSKATGKKPPKVSPSAQTETTKPERNLGGRPKKDAPPKTAAERAQREAERRAYQREYMKEYRQRQKEAKGTA
jgi:hypothetical protein